MKEEPAGEGRIISLVDIDSVKSRHYGELTFFTYEIEQTGGSPIAGEDATKVNFFDKAAFYLSRGYESENGSNNVLKL